MQWMQCSYRRPFSLTHACTSDTRSHNRLTRLDGLGHLPNLRTLNAARNYLRDDGECVT